MIKKQSFLSNMLGDTYSNLKRVAIWVSLLGTAILIVLYILSKYFHSGFVSSLLNLTSGVSLLFIGYIAAIIVLADRRVDVDEPEYYLYNEKKEPKPFKYKLTIAWGVILLAFGIVAIYYSDKYKTHYAFECDTFLVDVKTGIYHLTWNDDCSIAEEAERLDEMQGWQIDQSFQFCGECQDALEDAAP